MSQLLSLPALLFASECFAASVLLLGCAAIVVRFVKCASLRHLVWLTAFGTMLALPVAALVIPPQIAIHQRIASTPAIVDAVSMRPASVLPALPPVQQRSWYIGLDDIALALLTLWLIGFGWSVLRLLIGAIGINALSMSSRRMADETRLEVPNAEACELRVADDRSGPMTWGTLRPVILLPNEATGWPPERLRAVLLHELAHVRRHDSLAQSVSRIGCALYWPNPLAWIGARAMRRDAEIAADDAVIGARVRPSVYARELLELAAAYRSAPGFAGAGLSMAAESRLEARVKSILGPNGLRRGVRFMDIAKFAGAGLLAAAGFAFVRPSLAQDAPAVAAVRVHAAPWVLAQNERPPVPPAPDAPPAPPVPPTSDVAPVPPVPPTPAVPPSPDSHYAIDMHGDLGRSMHDMHVSLRHMTPEEQRKLHAILHNLHHEIHDAMAKARPEMRRALADLQAHGTELEAIRPQIEQAMREARPQIEQAMAEARRAAADAQIDERVRRHIEHAMRQVEMHMRDRDRGMNMHDWHERDMHGSHSDDRDMDNPDPNPDPGNPNP